MISRRLLMLATALSLTGVALFTTGSTAQSARSGQADLPKQSPIDITAHAVRADHPVPPLRVFYRTSAVTLTYLRKDADTPDGCTSRHSEETEQATIEPDSAYVTLSGVRYDLVQFHFHTPSEHRLAGRAAPMEMHLVHRSADGHLLVIGIPLLAGQPSTVDKVLTTLAPECGQPVPVGRIDLNSLLPTDRTSLRYSGSLTTAPFTEGVQWFLMREQHLTQATISHFQSLFFDGNARPTQPLNGRTLAVEYRRR